MKKLLLLVSLIFISIYAHSQTVWISQATGFTPVSSGVRNVSVVDSNIVWLASYDGSGGAGNRQDFSRTLDGGNNWTAGITPAPPSYNWSMIFGINATTAWAMFYNSVAATGGGGIWKTTDGGMTWNQQGIGTMFTNTASFPDVVHFWTVDTGFALGDPNPSAFEIYTTVDGGTNWTLVPSVNIPTPLSGEYGIVDHYAVLGNTIWFDTNKGRVYRSTDRGLTWTVSSTGITVPANAAIDVVFYDQAHGVARLATTAGTGNSAVNHSGYRGA